MTTQIIDLQNPLWPETLATARHDIYHLPGYLRLESLRIGATPEAILISEGDRIFFLPYLRRSCEGLVVDASATEGISDVISPYGYPGIVLSPAASGDVSFIRSAVDHLIEAFRGRGLCSAFIRLHPALNAGLEAILPPSICHSSGETVSIDLTLTPEEIWSDTRPEHRTSINRLKRSGMTAHILPFQGGDAENFKAVYYETMDRVEATPSYYFDDAYFAGLAALGDKIHLCNVVSDGQIACSGIFTECCGTVQYHLGGTAGAFLKLGPSKLMFDHVRSWAKGRGNRTLHLGGGVGGAKDNLYRFKAGFSKVRNLFLTLRIITDPEKYSALTGLREDFLHAAPGSLAGGSFFPAYRAGA